MALLNVNNTQIDKLYVNNVLVNTLTLNNTTIWRRPIVLTIKNSAVGCQIILSVPTLENFANTQEIIISYTTSYTITVPYFMGISFSGTFSGAQIPTSTSEYWTLVENSGNYDATSGLYINNPGFTGSIAPLTEDTTISITGTEVRQNLKIVADTSISTITVKSQLNTSEDYAEIVINKSEIGSDGYTSYWYNNNTSFYFGASVNDSGYYLKMTNYQGEALYRKADGVAFCYSPTPYIIIGVMGYRWLNITSCIDTGNYTRAITINNPNNVSVLCYYTSNKATQAQIDSWSGFDSISSVTIGANMTSSELPIGDQGGFADAYIGSYFISDVAYPSTTYCNWISESASSSPTNYGKSIDNY